MKTTVRIEGLRDLERALQELPKGVQRGTLRRAGLKAMQPMADIAAQLAPFDTGALAASIAVSARAQGAGASVGKAQFAAVLRGGGTRQEAVAALRAARRAAHGDSGPPTIELFMGPAVDGASAEEQRDNAIKAQIMEYGSSRVAAQPYLRPAWDQDHRAMLDRLSADLGREIEKSATRAARRRARAAG